MHTEDSEPTGLDGVTGRVLRECADQRTGIFSNILKRITVPAFHPPKKIKISSLYDYQPVALTPVIMKCFEKLVQRHIMSCFPPTFDPFQFAYRHNISTEDAIVTMLHTTISHLKQQGHYARQLFVNFSSAFNTILQHRLPLTTLEFFGGARQATAEGSTSSKLR